MAKWLARFNVEDGKLAVRVLLENEEDEEPAANNEFLDESATSLWIVSKELQAGKIFSDYFGKNEKQKFVVKL